MGIKLPFLCKNLHTALQTLVRGYIQKSPSSLGIRKGFENNIEGMSQGRTTKTNSDLFYNSKNKSALKATLSSKIIYL
jgi:hypothetical protein